MRICKKITFLLCVCLLLQLCGSSVMATAELTSNKSLTDGCNTLDAQVPFLGSSQLITNATSVVLFENNSQTLMYAWNADEQLYPASFVKILTALIAIERGNMEDIVTVRQEILDTVPSNAVSAELMANEVLTLRDLLYCLLVGSANDAAAVIADHICGSQAAFVEEMNLYAQQLGCTNTQFMNVHGLHDPQQYTTARDTVRILSAAMRNELFCEFFGTVRYTVDPTNRSTFRKLATGNFLMNPDEIEIYYDERVVGGRTGTTDNGDLCIAAAAEKDGLQLISVIMGAKSTYEKDGYTVRSFGGFPETTELLNHGFGAYKVSQVIYKNQALTQKMISNGDCDLSVAPDISVSTVLPSSTSLGQLSYVYHDIPNLQAPIEKGQKVSVVEVWFENLCVAQADLYALNKVEVKQSGTVIQSDDTEGNPWKTALIIVGVLMGVVIVWLLIRYLIVRLHHVAAIRASRRHRRDRRRSR